ncbi:HAD family hydrolase [Paenibacillaceae bacterium WGS1546]|uniref:HAD family hydrolase n=1 Tax=Cohnella sp. WGS1546 TaxID=3366810 RepID=UPI00372D0787
MKQTILFDLDDTLVYCNKYFHAVLDRFARQMEIWFGGAGVKAADVAAKQIEIDVAGIRIHGFMSEHFPQSLVDTYRYFRDLTGRASSPFEEESIRKLGNSLYELEIEPYPAMEETLETLAGRGHELHLYTGGDYAIQLRKIESMRLERYFDNRIYVRQHKNAEALDRILTDGRFDRSNTWMIGNSIRTDVVPALQCGLHAVYLKQEAEWTYNVVPIDAEPTGAFFTLTKLPQVPPAIEQYLLGGGMRETS